MCFHLLSFSQELWYDVVTYSQMKGSVTHSASAPLDSVSNLPLFCLKVALYNYIGDVMIK